MLLRQLPHRPSVIASIAIKVRRLGWDVGWQSASPLASAFSSPPLKTLVRLYKTKIHTRGQSMPNKYRRWYEERKRAGASDLSRLRTSHKCNTKSYVAASIIPQQRERHDIVTQEIHANGRDILITTHQNENDRSHGLWNNQKNSLRHIVQSELQRALLESISRLREKAKAKIIVIRWENSEREIVDIQVSWELVTSGSCAKKRSQKKQKPNLQRKGKLSRDQGKIRIGKTFKCFPFTYVVQSSDCCCVFVKWSGWLSCFRGLAKQSRLIFLEHVKWDE